jgi:hypothetical protein
MELADEQNERLMLMMPPLLPSSLFVEAVPAMGSALRRLAGATLPRRDHDAAALLPTA